MISDLNLWQGTHKRKESLKKYLNKTALVKRKYRATGKANKSGVGNRKRGKKFF